MARFARFRRHVMRGVARLLQSKLAGRYGSVAGAGVFLDRTLTLAILDFLSCKVPAAVVADYRTEIVGVKVYSRPHASALQW